MNAKGIPSEIHSRARMAFSREPSAAASRTCGGDGYAPVSRASRGPMRKGLVPSAMIVESHHQVFRPSSDLKSPARGAHSRLWVLEPSNQHRGLPQGTRPGIDLKPTAGLEKTIHAPTVVGDRKIERRQFSTRHMASHEHRENHLSRLPPPAPLVPTSKHSDQLHRDCGTAFTPPANGGPPSRAAQRKRVNARVKGDSVIFAQDEEATHAPIRSSICGGKSGHCHIDVSSQDRPRTTADHSADFPSHRLGYPRGGTTAMSTDGRSSAQIARTS